MRKTKKIFRYILIIPLLLLGILLPVSQIRADGPDRAKDKATVLAYSQLQADTAKYTNPDTNYQVFIDDSSDLLSDKEEAEIVEAMKPITKYGGAAFVTKAVSSGSTESYAKELAYKYYTGDSGTVFLIDMGHRKVYMYSTGKMSKTLTSGKALSITDNVYSYAKKGNYLKCASEAFKQAGTLLRGGRIAQPMKYISNALIAVIVSLIIMYFIVKTARGTVAKKNGAMLGAVKTRFNVDNLNVELVKTEKNVDADNIVPTIVGGIGGFHIGGGDFGGGDFGGGDSDGGGSGGGHSF
ncbi:MAG: TPM domain-containing protein [Clostridiales bacterium]|nr:TPM domain-containing protein [Clostridiales bacterium]MBS5877374.1 TPM domain-containing protein [Clostridiales bacterium]MDU0939215.1 TPM domain-containing protein [Clostridiales bacterium]MDU1042140.1 TPM domain-containing protein [Clostridiales bacterium]